MAWTEAHLHAKCHLDPSSRLATIDMAESWGLRPLFGEGAGSTSNTMSLGPKSTCIPSGILIHPAVWPHQTWAENWRRALPPPFLVRGKLDPHPTVAWAEAYLHTKWHLDPSNRLGTIHQRDRQTRHTIHDNGSDNIRRTAAPKQSAILVSLNGVSCKYPRHVAQMTYPSRRNGLTVAKRQYRV